MLSREEWIEQQARYLVERMPDTVSLDSYQVIEKEWMIKAIGIALRDAMAFADANPIAQTVAPDFTQSVSGKSDGTIGFNKTDATRQEDGAGPDAGTRSIPARHDDQQASDAPAIIAPAPPDTAHGRVVDK